MRLALVLMLAACAPPTPPLATFTVSNAGEHRLDQRGCATLTTNRRFFSGFDQNEVAGHLAHEWLHKLGFEHDFQSTARRPDSVPYELGELVERLAKGALTPLS